MSSLANQQQNLTYPGLLQIPGGITTTLQQVQDGNGNVTGLSLSSAGASVTTSSTFQASQNGTTLTGATARLISDGFGDLPTVKDFGAVGDGTTDDTAAFTAAIAASPTGVAVPAGSYKITGTVTGAFYSFGVVTVVTGTVTSIQNVSLPYTSSSGSSLIGTIQSGTGAVARTVASKLNDIINVRDFGAIGDGVADDTAAIQAAVDAASSGGTVIFPKGTFLVSATINCLYNQQIIGSGVNNTVFRRYGDYGNTLSFANAGAALIKGIWFWHGNLPGVGYTTLDFLATSGAHVYFGNAQYAIIEECWMWRLPFGVNVAQGSLIKINKCSIQGCWNRYASAAAQEGISTIYIGSAAYTQLVEITNCYFAGANAGAQTVTYVTTDNGTQSYTMPGTNAGSQHAIRVNTCEGLYVDGCYMGGQAYNNILFSTNGTTSEVRISNNFFDGAGYDSPCIYFTPQTNGQYVGRATIANNCFNTQLVGFQAIGSYNSVGTQPTLVNFQITGNSITNTIGSGIFLRRVQGGVISDNVIGAYNTGNLSPGGDPNFCCGIYVDNSSGTYIANNVLGGAINSALPTGSFCYQGAVIAGTNTQVDAKNNYFNGVGVSALNVGRIDRSIVVSSTNLNYTMTGDEDLIVINNSGTTAIQITPPTNVPPGYTFAFKDGSGTAATYPLQFVGTVDGSVNPAYSTNYVVKTFTWNGTQWNVTGN